MLVMISRYSVREKAKELTPAALPLALAVCG